MKAGRRITASVAIVAFVLVSADGAAQDAGADLRFSTGIEYSTGKYGGSDDIEELYVPFTFRVGLDRVGFRLTAPYLSVTAPDDTVITEPGTEPLPGSGETVTESGLGDVIGALTLYDVYVSDSANFVIDVTGKNDYTLQFDAYRFFDRFSLQGSAGYRLRGDPPGYNLDDVLLASVGGAYLASDNTMVGMYFDYRESSISGVDDIQELSGFASFRLGRAWRMELYAFTGLTDSSTDFGGGILFSTDLSQLRVTDRQDY
jgi:hypothetical protein